MKNIYKLRYVWYEGDEGDRFVMTDLDNESFEKLLVKGTKQICHYPEKGFKIGEKTKPKTFSVRCLPEAYDFLCEFLEENGCDIGTYNNWDDYFVEDAGTNTNEFFVEKRTKNFNRNVLR